MAKRMPDPDLIQKHQFSDLLSTVGARVRNMRKSQSLTGRALADRAGVSHATIVAVETGATPSLLVLFMVSDALGIHISDLLAPTAPKSSVKAAE